MVQNLSLGDSSSADLGVVQAPTETGSSSSWVNVDELDAEDEVFVDEYDIVSAPNDWNVLTISSYMQAGAIKIPSFQRNYVWDIKKASKLIESLLLGIPVPQIFLYEESRNSFLVIDGQQRLLTIFFYLSGRFPRPARRGALRPLLQAGALDVSALANDELFQDFALQLPMATGLPPNRFHKKKYLQLDDHRTSLDLRTLRNVVVKQASPKGHGAIYEIFNRLNTGGVNLSPQEVRASLYHSRLMTAISDLNEEPVWRKLSGKESPDGRMRDVEILLRSLALAINGDEYSSPMTTFVNNFCISAQKWTAEHTDGVVARLRQCLQACSAVGAEPFSRGNRFSPVLFETVIVALWNSDPHREVTQSQVVRLAQDPDFVGSLQEGSTKNSNVTLRSIAAKRYFG